jgi:hypothetical protein
MAETTIIISDSRRMSEIIDDNPEVIGEIRQEIKR